MERPLLGEERTYLTTVGMSANSQKRTFREDFRRLCQTKSYQPQECAGPAILTSQLTPLSQGSRAVLLEDIAAV
jgi:hypothetical protein